MNILLLTDRMDAGGAETHVAQLARELARAGNEITLLSGGGSLIQELEAEGIRTLPAPLPTHNPLRLLRLYLRVRRLLRTGNFAIAHAHTRLTALLLRGCERYGTRAIVTVHAHFRVNALFKALCYWGHRTVAVSEDLRTYVCDAYHVPAERVTVIPNGIDCTRFAPPSKKEQAATARILFASRMDADCSQAAEWLCQMTPTLIHRFPYVSIEIAGGGSALPHVRKLAQTVNREVGWEVIRILGHVADMPSLLREQDIFVGVSRAAMEACACGCAVVLCGNEGYFGVLTPERLPEAARSNFCARGCKKGSAERLRSDLFSLLEKGGNSNPSACVAWIRANHNAEKMGAQTLALYLASRSHPIQKRLAICGYFGCGNAGDDAILEGLTHELSRLSPTLHPYALTGSPRRDAKRFGVSCVCRRSPLAILRTFATCDAVLFGGGSLLQNTTSNRSLLYYLTLVRLALLWKRPVFFAGAGIGPLLGKRAQQRATAILNRCNRISLRDPRSHRLLQALGVDFSLLHLGADPALLLPCPPNGRTEQLLCDNGLSPDASYLAVALRGGGETESDRKLIQTALRIVCERYGLIPLFLVFDPGQDRSFTRAACRAIGGRILRFREPGEAIAILSKCQLLVSMRLHALILSAVAKTPAVAIPSDPRDEKIPAFADQVGMQLLIPEQQSVPNLVEAIAHTLATRHTLVPVLCDSVAEMRKKAAKDLANTVEMIYNNNQ
ncbi:MAG: polysaccharide pyruvyl transferase CsaB [Clostridia bacterium]|nr:polysaccharide pyruvyl transferase CsaB [Clostridia bacterium]